MDQDINDLYKRSLAKFASTLTKKYKVPIYSQEVLLRLDQKRPCYKVIVNDQGHLVHPETNLIFDPSHKVIGKYKDGVQQNLSTEDIETCKQYKFDYEVPFSLDDDQDIENIKDEVDKILEN